MLAAPARDGAELFHADKTEHMDEQETQYGFDITTIRRKMSANVHSKPAECDLKPQKSVFL